MRAKKPISARGPYLHFSHTVMTMRMEMPEPAWARRVEIGLMVFAVGLFAYALGDWRGIWPWSSGYQPLRMVFLTAGMVLYGVASLVGARHPRTFWTLLVSSMLLLVVAMLV